MNNSISKYAPNRNYAPIIVVRFLTRLYGMTLSSMSTSEDRTSLQHAIDQILETDQEEQKKKGALFILNLKEIRCLSESAVGHVVKETQKVFKHTIGRIQAGVNECIAKNGGDPYETSDTQKISSK